MKNRRDVSNAEESITKRAVNMCIKTRFIQTTMSNWKTNMTLTYTEGTFETEPINPKTTHIFYVDDLKVYGKYDSQSDCLVKTVEKVSDDVKMEFGLDKLTKATFIKGKRDTGK